MQRVSLKEQLIARRSAKLRVEARRFLDREGGTDVVFARHRIRPTASQFEDMCVAAQFGPGDPLFGAGPAFALDYLLGDLNKTIEYLGDSKADEIGQPSTKIFDHGGEFNASVSTEPDAEFNARLWQFSTPNMWGNVFVQCVVASVLVEHLVPILPSDLVWDEMRRVYVDRESRAFGVRVLVSPFQAIAQMPLDPKSDLGTNPTHLKSNDTFCLYTVQLGMTDQFDEVAEADLHRVQSHDRHLSSGKVVLVKPHQRHNPTRGMSRRTNLGEVGHVVYKAYDREGKLRYVGEGTEDRPNHVNSGTSHNFKLNEHYFIQGAMRVEIVERGLSKSEALALEYLLIRKNRGEDLWNVKDNVCPLGEAQGVMPLA